MLWGQNMDKGFWIRFIIAFLVSAFAAVPQFSGPIWDWFEIVTYIIWIILLIWVLVSPARKPLVLGILSVFGLALLLKLTFIILKIQH
jgi:hypothetical protein